MTTDSYEEMEDKDFENMFFKISHCKWSEIKSKLPGMCTHCLIDLSHNLNLYVNKTIALEISQKKDAVFWLRKYMQDGSNWYGYDDEIMWFPVHALYILALIKNNESLQLFLDMIRYRGEDMGDLLTESVHKILSYFGENAIEKLMEFTRDETVEPFARSACTSALCIISKSNPSQKDIILQHLMSLFRATNDLKFKGLLADNITSLHEPSVMPEIYDAFDNDNIESMMTKKDIKYCFDNPRDRNDKQMNQEDILSHFSRKNINKFKCEDVRENIGKTGRNDPCPCGSGKKYKKCCMDKDI